MIKTALKHWIYEFCIDRFFDGIFKNFEIYEHKVTDFNVGDCIQLMLYVGHSKFEFRMCRVIYKKGNNMLIESHDTSRVIYIVLKHGVVIDISGDIKNNYEDYFKNK